MRATRPGFILIAAALAVAPLSLAKAQSGQTPPVVTVSLGDKLKAKAGDLGQSDLDSLRDDLRDQVAHALARSKAAPPVKVDLVIEDAVPNRPTMAQMSRTPGLSFRSIGVGGARVSGQIVYADGAVRPVRTQYYETDLVNERGADTWYDANRAFDRLAYDLRNGRAPDRFLGPGPSGDGHFGAPFNQR